MIIPPGLVDEDFLIDHDMQDSVELPLWLSYKRNIPGFLNVSITKALGAGLTFRPISETISDIRDWQKRKGDPFIGINPEKKSTFKTLEEPVNLGLLPNFRKNLSDAFLL